MSGIAGIIFYNNHNEQRPATIEQLGPVITELEMLGPDGISTWAEKNAAFAHFALHTTPEALFEKWPLQNATGDVLIADARLDNREELIRRLHYAPSGSAPITDAELILAAHAKWGNEAPSYLIGDFAYALWNKTENVLRLACSPFGIKGLYYRITSDAIFFASTLRGVVALAPNNLTTNLPWVASFLTLKMDYLFNESVYHEIKKVPAAHWIQLNLRNGSQYSEQFWDLIPDDSYTKWHDDEWVEAFREQFEIVVKASLRSAGPIAMSMSGGLDSSSIALVAHRLMHDQNILEKKSVYALTDRMPEWPETDEGQYRNEVVSYLNHFNCQWVEPKQAWTWEQVDKRQRHTSSPMSIPNIFTTDTRLQVAKTKGCKVMISGVGGDMVTGGEDYGTLEAFLSLPWNLRLQEWRYFARGTLSGHVKLAKRVIREQFPKRLVTFWLKHRQGPKLYNQKCEEGANYKKVLIEPRVDTTRLQHFLRIAMFSPLYVHPFEEVAEYYSLQGIERRCPFYDRRMIELTFQVPTRLRIHKGTTRVLHKRAFKDDLPALLFARNTKADFTRFTANSVSTADHARACALQPDSILKREGWINESTWQQWATNPGRAMRTIYLHRIAHLQNWLSLLDSSSSS